jgi:hypothetical protein
MMLLRRLLSAPLILVFIVVFIVASVLTEVNSKVGNPQFYIEQLRQADFYSFGNGLF